MAMMQGLEYNPKESRFSTRPEKNPRPHLYNPFKSTPPMPLLGSLEVVQDDGALLRLLTPVLNHDAGAVDDLARIALTVEDA